MRQGKPSADSRERENMVGAVFRVTYFFIDYWLPLLGPAAGWLVVALQQACWQRGQRRPRAQISQACLGQLSGLTRERVNRHLNDPSSYVTWFVSGTYQSERARYAPKWYAVPGEEPLPPGLAAGLQAYLAERAAHAPSPADWNAAASALSDLLGQEREWMLADLLRRGAEVEAKATAPAPGVPAVPTSPWRASGLARQVARAFGLGDAPPPAPVNALITRLAEQVWQPNQVYLGSQHFRRTWVPALGATLGWLLVVLRRHTFFNPRTGEQRLDFCLGKGELAARLGLTGRTLLRHLEPHVRADGSLRPDSLLTFFLSDLHLTYRTVLGRLRAEVELPQLPPSGQSVTRSGAPNSHSVTQATRPPVTADQIMPDTVRDGINHDHDSPGHSADRVRTGGDKAGDDCQALWQATLRDARLQMTRSAYEFWLSPTRALGRSGDVLIVGVPNPYALDMLQQRLARVLLRCLNTLPGGEGLRIEFRMVPRD